ncbi:MAG: class I SAM-dependent methyltransferase [Myxococcota bacterium]|nr:class I SAM-dependent methyltransferase [Myxococcota bacterium]
MKTQRQYDLIAPRYEGLFYERQAAKIERLRRELPPKLETPCLDLGAGTGLVSKVLGHPCIALDVSAGMLAQASGWRVCASMAALPFADETFPLVVSVSALTTDQDAERMLSESIRVLTSGGRLGLSVLTTEDIGGIERYLTGHRLIVRYTKASNGPDMILVAHKA